MAFRRGSPGFETSLKYPEATLPNLLSNNSSKLRRKVAVYFGSVDYSWQYLDVFSDAFANVLADLGVKKGAKVAVLLPNIPQLLMTLFGVWKAGGVAVLLDPWLGEKELKPKLADVRVAITISDVVLGHDVCSKLESIKGYTRIEHVITTSMTDAWSSLTNIFGVLKGVKDKRREGTVDWLASVTKRLGRKPPEVSLYPDDPAIVSYVGPYYNLREVVLSHKAIIANATQFVSCLKLDQNDVILSMLPLTFPFAFISSFASILLAEAKTVLVPLITSYSLKLVGTRSPDFVEALRKYKATLLIGSPSIFRAYTVLADKPETYKSVRAAVCLPVPPSEKVKSLFQRTSGVRLYSGYASPEGLITHLERFEGESKPNSMGQILPDTEAAVFQAENNDLPLEDNHVGVLGVRGIQFADIYSEATFKRHMHNLNSTGWVITGDYVKRDLQGNYIFVRPADGVLVTGGQRVWKGEVERLLSEHPAIRSYSINVEEDVFADQVLTVSIVIDTKKGNPTPKELYEYFVKNLALYKVPVKIDVIYQS